MLAELGSSVVSEKVTVVNEDTWRQASLEVSQRAALQTALMLGVDAHVDKDGAVVLVIKESISPKEVIVDLDIDAIPLQQAARH